MFLDIYLYHIHTTGVDAKLRSLSLTVKTLRYYRPRPGPAAAAAWPGRGTRAYWCQHADCGRRERSADTGADRPRWHCQIIAKCSARCPRHQQQPAVRCGPVWPLSCLSFCSLTLCRCCLSACHPCHLLRTFIVQIFKVHKNDYILYLISFWYCVSGGVSAPPEKMWPHC